MILEIRPAQLKDLAAIESVYREHAHSTERPLGQGGGGALRRQRASTRLWGLVSNTFAAVLPITSPAEQVYVGESRDGAGIQGFIQAQAAPGREQAWEILNLCLRPELDRFKAGTALLDHLCNEGLKRGVVKFFVRLSTGDPTCDLFRARGFAAYATEHALLADSIPRRPSPELSGWRPMRLKDQFALYLLYRAVTPLEVTAVEADTFKEWRQSFQQGLWTGTAARGRRQRQFLVERSEVLAWMGLAAGAGGRPHTLGLLARREPAELWPNLVDRALTYVAEHEPGPVWCRLRHYDQLPIQLLQRQGFSVIASQVLMARELRLRVPARTRVRVKNRRLVPQYS